MDQIIIALVCRSVRVQTSLNVLQTDSLIRINTNTGVGFDSGNQLLVYTLVYKT